MLMCIFQANGPECKCIRIFQANLSYPDYNSYICMLRVLEFLLWCMASVEWDLYRNTVKINSLLCYIASKVPTKCGNHWSTHNSTFVINHNWKRWVKYANFRKKYVSFYCLTGWWINTPVDKSWASTCLPVHKKLKNSCFISILRLMCSLQTFVYIAVTNEFMIFWRIYPSPGSH